jgi:hypothetical protein
MNENELDDVDMVVGMPKVHVLNIKAYLMDPLIHIIQSPLVRLVQMIVWPRQLPQGELSPMVRMQVISHIGFSDLGLLYWTLK